jgi:hypothetical protein
MDDQLLLDYVRSQVEEYFSDISDREPGPEEVDRVTHTVTNDAIRLIDDSIFNLCA